MHDAIQPYGDPQLAKLQAEEARLEARVGALERQATGLTDVDLTLRLASARLRIANRLLDATDAAQAPEERLKRIEQVRARARAAMEALEQLRRANVSEEQKHDLLPGEAYSETKSLFRDFIARGGGSLLQPDGAPERQRLAVARAVTAALRKFAGSAANYPPVFRTERLPRFLRRLVNKFLPLLAPENQSEPPYGIAAGSPEAEDTLRAERMKMPLSQAVFYLENELLPQLEEQLLALPGDPLLMHRLRLARERLQEYRGIKLRPRATPINLEQGFYTDWLSQYTADGELLVSINLPVTLRRGSNLDRLREMVQQEVVRRLAGRGISEDLDREYRYRRSLDSGSRGSSRVPSQKLDFARCYRGLQARHPGLVRLEDDRELGRLLEIARTGGRRSTECHVRGLLAAEGDAPLALP